LCKNRQLLDGKVAKLRVLIADDQALFAEALRAVLALDERLEVVGLASNGGQAVDMAVELKPDVVLMDISMPILDGLEATKQLRKRIPDACVLMLTGSNARSDVNRSRKAGASGFVTKDRIAAELVEAILDVAER
jgi:DNA-binding NarL/FixJ family response regulator